MIVNVFSKLAQTYMKPKEDSVKRNINYQLIQKKTVKVVT